MIPRQRQKKAKFKERDANGVEKKDNLGKMNKLKQNKSP